MKAKKTLPESATWPYYAVVTAALVYIACEVYGPALRGPFVYDDFSLPYYNPLFRDQNLSAWIAGVRPLLLLSYWLNFHFSGRETFSYHVVNLLLHLGNATAVYLIARRILSWEALDRWRREVVAGFSAALFLLHPIQTESVAWVAGRSEDLSAFFFLWAFAAYLYRSTDAIGWGRSASVLALFACAVASKEHTATLPIILLLTDIWQFPENRIAAVRRNWRLYGPLLCGMLLSGIFIWQVVSGSKSAGFHGTGIGWLSYALTQCRVFFVYLRMFVIPYGQNIDYDMPWSPARFQLVTAAGLAGIVLLAALAWRLRRRFPVGSYGIFLFLILLAPTSSIIPIKDPIAERRLYLPMLGLVLVAAEFLIHTIRQRVSIVAVASLVIAVAAITASQRSRLWGSEAALWEDTVAKSPNKLRGYGHLVHGLVEEHRCREALQRLDEASRRLPVDVPLLGHWAVAYECVHEPEHALAKLELVAAQAPSALTYVDMARNQIALNHDDEAIESLDRALKLDANLESALLTRAQVYERRGDLPQATRDYRATLDLDPGNEPVRWRLQQIAAYTLHR